jgi:hypothetical protein
LPKNEVKILTEDAAFAVRDNFRWFAGFNFRAKKLGKNKWAVTCPKWCWSFIGLVPEDYAR